MFRRTVEFIALDEEERTRIEAAWSRVFKMSVGSTDGRSAEQVHGFS